MGNLAGGLGHAVAGVDARFRRKRACQGLAVQGAATQKDAPVALQHLALVGVQQVLQHLVHHRHVRRMAALRVLQEALRVEACIEHERVAVREAAHEHLKPADVVQRKRRLPQPFGVLVEHGVGRGGGSHEVLPGQRHGFGLARRARREHDQGARLFVEQARLPLGEMDGLFFGVLLRPHDDAAAAARGPRCHRLHHEGRKRPRLAAAVVVLGLTLARQVGLHARDQAFDLLAVDAARKTHPALTLQLHEARLLFGRGEPVIERDQRERRIGRSQQ